MFVALHCRVAHLFSVGNFTPKLVIHSRTRCDVQHTGSLPFQICAYGCVHARMCERQVYMNMVNPEGHEAFLLCEFNFLISAGIRRRFADPCIHYLQE
jgi:hypothetical protein